MLFADRMQLCADRYMREMEAVLCNSGQQHVDYVPLRRDPIGP
jgi:hypothetical protein